MVIALSETLEYPIITEQEEREAAIASLNFCHGLGLGLAGAHRTGKTSLARRLADELEIPFLETSVKSIAAEYGFDVDRHDDFYARMDWQEFLLERLGEKYASMEGRTFITDRTPLCMLAYMLADVPNGPITQEMDDRVKSYRDACMALTDRYFALTAVVQPGIPFEPVEGAPALNTGYQEKVSSVVVAHTLDLEVSGILILERDVIDMDQRVAEVAYHWDEEMEWLSEAIYALPRA